MKKITVSFLTIICAVCLFAGCGEKKIVHCDGCGAEIEVDADSNVNDTDWTLFCSTCEAELDLEDVTSAF